MIYGERIRLRAIERTDLALFTEWLNDPEVRRGLMVHLPFSMAEEESWYENMLKSPQEEHPLRDRDYDRWRLGTDRQLWVIWY